MRTMYILRTDRPTLHFLENFERPYLGNGSSDLLHVWCLGRVFEVGGSNVSTSGWTKFKIMAISVKRFIRSNSYLVLR